MSNTSIETVSSSGDKLKLVASGLLLIGGLVAYYLLAKEPLWMRIAVLIVGLLLAVGAFLISEPGKQFIAYTKDSWQEVRKVVWPTRQESMQMTLYVFGFVFVMSLFLWLTDKTLEWLVYDLLLKLKR
jgi:preprotein translocase subunit SecE